MKILLSALLLSVVACSSGNKTKEEVLPKTLEEAVNSSLRTPDNKKRDIYRHPLETLKFFGVTSTMTVVEIWPSGGWYTEILAPFLAENGKYVIADPAADPNGYTTKRKEWMNEHKNIASKTSHTVFMPDEATVLVENNSADVILTFRNVHNWQPVKAQEAAFKVFFKALKPGGVLGVVEHRASAKKKFDPKSGYVLESEVIRMAKKAGFILAGKSEVNANAKDTTNHPEGVWTLPPRLKLGEQDKEKYLAIGESDRMTLKFVKPKK